MVRRGSRTCQLDTARGASSGPAIKSPLVYGAGRCWQNSCMATILNQLPALVGVALGILGTLLVTSVSDRARWKRDQSVRWDQRRLEAYTEYARAIKEMYTTALHMSE